MASFKSYATIAVAIVWAAAYVAVIGAIGYVAWHFISKFW